MEKEKSRLVVWGTLVLLAFVWGSSFILMKVSLFDSSREVVYSALEVAALRITIAGVVLLPVSIRHLKRIKRSQWLPLLAIGTLGNMLPAYLFSSAVTEIPSAIAGMLNALTPLFTMIVAALVFHTVVSKRQFSGLVIGFMGALLLAIGGGGLSNVNVDIEWWACGRVALATLLYGISVNILKNKLQDVSSTAIAAIALLLVTPPAIFVVVTSDVGSTLVNNDHGVTGMVAVAVLAAIGTAGALIIFNNLIKWTDALTASSVTYILPLFAAMWGWLDGEVLTVIHFTGGAIILFGVALVNGVGKSVKS
ncbi:MAG TPA: DMT family transporter [Flavobacteriales bacterium]|nr:DMT family transporter [Flavobacteriales bacterium]